MKIAVIVTQFGHTMHVGGEPETKVRMFEIPDELAAYITANRNECSSVTLAIEDNA